MTLSLTGGTAVTRLDAPAVVPGGAVVISAGRVSSVGAAAEGGTKRDCSGCLILPGNVCAHTHLYSALARGMPYRLEPPADFPQILQRIWWRLDRALDEDSIRWSAIVGGMGALLAGTTTVVDHHASPNSIDGSLDIVSEALEQIGLRSLLCYEVSDRDGPRRAASGLRESERFLRVDRRLARGLVGAHASFTISEQTMAALAELSARTGAGMHVHVAEDVADERDSVARFGVRVAQRLNGAGVLRPGAILAHCVHLNDEERELVRASGATVAHNPSSNMNNSVGHAAVAALGKHVALGTDGIGADMFAEARASYFRARDDDVQSDMGFPLASLAEGARLVGECFGESALGRIEPGAPADLVVLDYDPPAPLDAGNVAGHWMFGFLPAKVRDVFVGGEMVVEDGRLTNLDQRQLTAEAALSAERLWARMDEIPAHDFCPQGGP
jgi:putative selenium metabolism protein SsnA